MTDAAVQLAGVTFAYGRAAPVICNCTLDIARGRILSILGPNGSGKTTLLKLVAGALAPSGGTVTVHGQIGYVPQLVQISFAYSVLDVVLMGRARKIGLLATPTARDEQAAIAALDRVGMRSFTTRAFDELSGGERQLVVFARALAAEADVLVLDEPMASLDLRHQEVVLKWMRRLAHDDGLTVVFSTHQPQHADAIADDVALIAGVGAGRIAMGVAREMMHPAALEELFGVGLRRISGAGDDTNDGVLVPAWKL